MIDPNENLKEQLRLASMVIHAYEDGLDDGRLRAGSSAAAANLAELVIELDKHLVEGGDPPATWKHPLEPLPSTVAFLIEDAASVRAFFNALRANHGARAAGEELTAGARAKLAALGFFG